MKNKMFRIKLAYKLNLIWIPEHINITGNELADKPAFEDASSINYETVNLLTSLIRDFKTLDCLLKEKNLIFIQKKFLMLRKNQVYINRLRIGHTCSTHSFFMVNKLLPLCGSCGAPLTAKHVFTECRTYLKTQNELDIVVIIGHKHSAHTTKKLKKKNHQIHEQKPNFKPNISKTQPPFSVHYISYDICYLFLTM